MNALKCLLFFCLVLAHGIEATKGKGTKSFIYFDIFWLKSTEECNLGGGFGGGGFGGGYGGFGGGFGGGYGGSVLLINHSTVRSFITKKFISKLEMLQAVEDMALLLPK